MDFIRRNKLLGGAVIVLVIFNAALLVFLWLGRLENNRLNNGPEGKGRLLEERLNLSPDQVDQLETLKAAHFKQVNQYQREFHETRRQLHGLLNTENPKEKARVLASKMGDIQSKIEISTFEHFASIRAICTPEQQKTFDKIISEALRVEPNGYGPQGVRPPPREKGGR